MANFYGVARSNYFKVKDVDAFKAAMSEFDVDVYDELGEREVSIFPSRESEDGVFPSFMYDDELEDTVEVDIVGAVSSHLTEDSVAILFTVGSEKSRYLVGNAVAVNHAGDVLYVDINDIYLKVLNHWDVSVPVAF